MTGLIPTRSICKMLSRVRTRGPIYRPGSATAEMLRLALSLSKIAGRNALQANSSYFFVAPSCVVSDMKKSALSRSLQVHASQNRDGVLGQTSTNIAVDSSLSLTETMRRVLSLENASQEEKNQFRLRQVLKEYQLHPTDCG